MPRNIVICFCLASFCAGMMTGFGVRGLMQRTGASVLVPNVGQERYQELLREGWKPTMALGGQAVILIPPRLSERKH